MKRKLLIVVLFLLGSAMAFSQVSVSNAAPTATINFSSSMQTTVGYGAFTGAGFSPTSIAGRLNSAAWETKGWDNGDLLFGGSMTNPAHGRGAVNAGVVTEGIYAFTDTPASTANPALMIQPSQDNFQPGSIALKIKNNGTANMTQLEVSYNLFFRNDEASSSSFNFSHSADNLVYQDEAALDFTSPEEADALQWVLVDVSPSRSIIISGINVPPGGFYYIRWSSALVSGSGGSDEFGLDDITVTGTYGPPAPEINVVGNNLTILNGDLTPSVPDGTIFANTYTGGSQSIIEYRIQNLGGADLTVSNITITGVNPADFVIHYPSPTNQPTGVISAISGSVVSIRSLFIKFSPLASGLRTALINIYNNDSNESVYTFRVQGQGVDPQPDIDLNGLTGGTAPIYSTNMIPATGNNTQFGSTIVGGAGVVKDYKIKNNGTASTLWLTGGSPYIFISGNNPGDFILETIPTGPSMNAGFTKTFSIRFVPTAAGIRSAIVTIPNNDAIPDVFGNIEGPFTFLIQGTGVAPEIDITGNSQPIVSGSTTTSFANHTYFDNINITTGTLDRTYTIKNSGTMALTVGAVTLSGSPNFTLMSSPAASVAVGATTSFTIRFDPSTVGTHNAVVSIASNDFDENPYTFVIGGYGVNYVPCSFGVVETIGVQDFETAPATPAWTFTTTGTTYTTATAYGLSGDGGSSNRFLGARAIQVSNATGSVTFGAINTTQYSDIELNVRLSSLSVNATDGNDTTDKVIIAVSANGGSSWSNEMEIRGSTDAKWTFVSGTGIASTIYDGNGTAVWFAPSVTGYVTTDGFSTLSLTGLPNVSNLMVRITMNNNNVNEIWALDNVTLFGRKEQFTTWNGSTWSNLAPTQSVKAIIDGNFDTNIHGNLQACKCEIKTGRTVVIQPNHFFNIESDLDNYGTITIENNGSLVQRNDFATNAGMINVKRHTTPMTRYDYTYWSSPVNGQTLFNLSPLTMPDKYFSFNPVGNTWVNIPGSTIMEAGKGYIARAPQTFSLTVATPYTSGVFAGLTNNGFIQTPITGGAGAWNLIGNPYPSSISANEFLTFAPNTGVVGGTIYFWTHNTPLTNNVYTSNDYAVYNLTGGVGTQAASSGVNNTIPTGNIASGQGFFVAAISTGNATFNNSMRQTGSNAEFFRSTLSSNAPLAASTPAFERSRIWLNLSNSQGAFKQTMVGYLTNATNELDRDFDGSVLEAGNPISFYSILPNHKLAIQGRALPFNQEDRVPLGFATTINGEFQIAVENIDGFLTGQTVYLEDKLLNIIHDIKTAPYVFTTVAGTHEQRFELRYTNNALAVVDNVASNLNVMVAVKDRKITVRSEADIKQVIVYDLLGRLVKSSGLVNDVSHIMSMEATSQQTLIVKVVLNDGSVYNTKVVLE